MMSEKLKPGDIIVPKVIAPYTGKSFINVVNLVSDYGISNETSKDAVHDNQRYGYSMWMKNDVKDNFEIVFDLQGNYPVGEMWIWNYNRFDPDNPVLDYTLGGLKAVRLFTSIDGYKWKELKGSDYPYVLKKGSRDGKMPATNLVSGKPIDFGGVTARYIKIEVDARPGIGNWDEENKLGNSFGLSKVRLFMGEGYAVIEDSEWTGLFADRKLFGGSDGIFSTPVDGCESQRDRVDTVFTFGDTLIGDCDPEAGTRSRDTYMINNSLCLLKGNKPVKENASFFYNKSENGTLKSAFIPDLTMLKGFSEEIYFWPQDSVVVNGNFYNFPIVISDDPTQPEGFTFRVEGMARIKCEVKDGFIDYRHSIQENCGLFHTFEDGSMLYFGCAILNNTIAAGAPDPDGYIYVYGHKNKNFMEYLYVSRVKQEDFDDLSLYRFWNGSEWVPEISEAVPVTENISNEMSFSPVTGKLHNGEYIVVFSEYVNSPYISCRFAKSPVGPFGEVQPLYYAREVERGRSIYAYNSKAHPHLSREGELLITYNVNACNWDMHLKYADIYSPRFLRLVEVVSDDK